VNDFGRKNLYRNNGDGTFTDVAPQAGVEDIGAGMSVCWLDYDDDGAEDIYVAICGLPPESAFRRKKFSRKTRPKKFGLCIENTRWEIRFSKQQASQRRTSRQWRFRE
jgi:hypothetical protein